MGSDKISFPQDETFGVYYTILILMNHLTVLKNVYTVTYLSSTGYYQYQHHILKFHIRCTGVGLGGGHGEIVRNLD